MICSTLDFAQASFGLVGTLFLATAAIKASGMAKVAGWFLLIGLPISFIQVAEVGMHTPWTIFLDTWVTPINEIVQQIVIGLAFCDILHRRLKSDHSETGNQPYASPADPKNVQPSRPVSGMPGTDKGVGERTVRPFQWSRRSFRSARWIPCIGGPPRSVQW